MLFKRKREFIFVFLEKSKKSPKKLFFFQFGLELMVRNKSKKVFVIRINFSYYV